MSLDEKLERSKSSEKIDFTKIGCRHVNEALVPVPAAGRIRVEPIWTMDGDFEGRLYNEYRAEYPEYDRVYVRTGLLERLNQAAVGLPETWEMVVRAGHRPPAVQRRLLFECAEDYQIKHPGASAEEALAHARVFVSDPDIKLPPHCCGAAVDVDVFDTAAGGYVDFGSPVNLDAPVSFLHSREITPDQRANRMQLLEAMLAEGFSSYYAEWWHFSYGDEIWAWFYGHTDCLYDVAEI
jgi:D-alanyl-D-alanine dipeptidase